VAFAEGDPAFCRQRCNADTADDTSSEDCPLNSWCFDVGGTTAGLAGACVPGDCATNIFDDAACDGTGTCLPIGNGASFCINAGTATEGDPCGLDQSTTPPASDVCAPGLLCQDNTCIQPCDLRNGDADCGEGDECLSAFDITPRNRPGLCGNSCTPFSTGECGESALCQPALGRAGVNTWLCTPTPDNDEVAPGEICNTAENHCQEGYLCVGTEQDAEGNTIARCLAVCDPAAELAGDSPCGGDVAGATLIESVAFGAASGYLSLPGGTYGVQVRDAGSGGLITDLDVNVVAGEVHTELATLNGDGAFTRFTYVDLRAGETTPANGLRVIHAAGGVGPVDVYLASVLSSGLASGASTGYTQVAAGGYNLWINGATSIIEPGVAASGASVDVIVAGSGTVFSASDSSAAGGSDARIRIAHAAASAPAVDIYADCTGGYAGCTASNLVVANLAFGQFAAGGAYVPVAAGDHTVYIAVAGSDPAAGSGSPSGLVATVPVTLAAGSKSTAVANDASGSLAVALTSDGASPASGKAAIRVHNFTSAAFSLVAHESNTAAASDLAFGEAAEGDASAYIPVEAGSYVAVVRAAGSPSDGDTLLVEPLAIAGLVTAVAAIDEGAVLFTTNDVVTAPGTGEGAVRVLHAAGGVGPVAVTLPGNSGEVCAPSAINGIGFCNQACTPFPRDPGSNYGCDGESQGCFPIVLTDAEATAPIGICNGDTGTIAPYEACADSGSIGECDDQGVCLDFSDDSTDNPTCAPLCAPLTHDAVCGDGATCSPILPLVGNLAFGLCTEEFTSGNAGDRCTTEGIPCEGDGSLCLDLGSGPVCVYACREGFDDCADQAGTDCAVGTLNPDVVPGFMGLCIPN
jgi:hypothetical protein